MRRFSRFSVSALVAGALACAPVAPRPAQAQLATYCANCATRVNQLIAHAKRLEQLAEAITTRVNNALMLKNQITNMITLPGQVWHQIESNFQNTQALFNEGFQIKNSMHMASSQLHSYRGLLGTVTDMPKLYEQWSKQANDNVTATFRGMGLMQSQMRAEQNVIQQIRARSAGSVGAMQAIQAQTEMGGAMVNELHRLRQIALEDARMNANALAIQAERQAAAEADQTRFFATPPQSERGNRRF